MSSLLGSDLRKEVIELELIYRERKKRHDIGNPVTFGWPDLLEEQQSYEDDEAFALRRRTRLRDFIENVLYFTKDGKKINIHVIDGSKDFPNSMLNMIYDCFYGVKDKAILWKPRGSGGSISVSIIIFLCMVYRKISFTLIAGSEKQAKVVYNYVMQLWNCNTAMAHQMLAKSPTSTKIITVPEAGSTTLECITASEKAVRGIHTAGLVIDECCLLPDTWIFTDSGMRKIQDVVVGDKVWTHKGRWKKVLETKTFYKEDEVCTTLHPVGALPYSTTGDHRCLTENQDWVTAENWKVKDKTFFAKPNSDRTEFDRPEWLHSEIGWHFLGQYLGDGHSNLYDVNLTIGHIDTHHKSYMDNVRHLFGVEPTICDVRDGCARIRFSPGKEKVVDLQTLCGTNAHRKGIPTELLFNATDTELQHFIKGLIETDGCLSQETSSTGGTCNRIFYYTVSDLLAQNFFFACNRLGYNPSIRRQEARVSEIKGRGIKSSDQWVMTLSGPAVRYFAPLLDPSFTDDRKRNFGQRVKQSDIAFHSPIRKTESFIYTGPVYDLAVEDDVCFSSPYMTFHNSQRDASTDKVLEAALQGPMSEPEHLIMACSTFHNPSGFYQELWDFSGEKGYTQYKWDILETMRPCRKPIDCRKCFLTKAVTQYTKAGEPTGVKYKECAGRARTTTGWQTYDQVATAKKQNIGSTVWEVEYLCSRPETGRTVYSTEKIVAAQKACPLNISGEPFVPFHPKETQLSIGVDWGLVQTAVVLLAKNPEYIGVLETKAFEGQPLTDIIRYLRQLHQKYRPGSLLSPAEKEKRRAERRLKQSGPVYVVSTGEDEFGYNEPITIWGDSSHPFNNMELGQLGYVVMPVPFSQYKDLGIENLVKYFYSGRVMLPQTHELLCRQLKLYARDLKGKPVKKNDHFPDAMMCAGLAFPYIENYGDRDLATGSIPHEKNQGVDVFSI